MTPGHLLIDRAARAALVLAEVPRDRQESILLHLADRLDPEAARRRRDGWLRQAHELIGNASGSVVILARALADYHRNIWPSVRHLPALPGGSPALRIALFNVCQACAEAGADIPGERQVRRIVF